MSQTLHHKWNTLSALLRKEKRVLIAFSGGCDSTFLMAAARRILGKCHVLAVTAMSASLAGREKRCAEELSHYCDVNHQWLETEEMSNPAYTDNPSNRCFYCKNELFGKLTPLAQQKGMTLLDGFNASDRSDYRPGFQAAADWGVKHLLDDSELTQKDIRILSRWLDLPTWNKPAAPCLSSRLPYGTRVTAEVLRKVEAAEEAVREEGFRIVRVRHYGEMARIEVPSHDLPRLAEGERWGRLVEKIQALGYGRVEADPRGFQSGRLNEDIRAGD